MRLSASQNTVRGTSSIENGTEAHPSIVHQPGPRAATTCQTFQQISKTSEPLDGHTGPVDVTGAASHRPRREHRREGCPSVWVLVDWKLVARTRPRSRLNQRRETGRETVSLVSTPRAPSIGMRVQRGALARRRAGSGQPPSDYAPRDSLLVSTSQFIIAWTLFAGKLR